MSEVDINLDVRLTKLEAFALYSTERQDTLIESVAQVRHILIEGNGRDPLVTRVATIETRLDAMDKRADSRAVSWPTWIGLVVAIALGVLGLVVK